MIAPGGPLYGAVISRPDRLAKSDGLCQGRLARQQIAFAGRAIRAGQLRRAAVGVPTNIAEGEARFSANEFYYF